MDVAPNIRTLRDQRGFTQAELAKRSGVSKTMICDVEAGKKNPTIRLLGQIAQGLDCGISELLDLEEQVTVTLDRKDKQRVLVDPENGMERRLLSRAMAKQGIEVLHYTFPPSAHEPWFPGHPKGTIETAYVIDGGVKIYVGDEEITLKAGDAATYAADLEHRVETVGKKAARVIFVTKLSRPA